MNAMTRCKVPSAKATRGGTCPQVGRRQQLEGNLRRLDQANSLMLSRATQAIDRRASRRMRNQSRARMSRWENPAFCIIGRLRATVPRCKTKRAAPRVAVPRSTGAKEYSVKIFSARPCRRAGHAAEWRHLRQLR